MRAMPSDGTVSLIPDALKREIGLHIEKVRNIMKPGTALIVAGNVNLFYCTGRFFRGYIWLPAEGEPLYFVVKPRVYSSADDVIYIRKPEMIPDELLKRGIAIPDEVGIEEDVLSYSDTMRLKRLAPQAQWFNASQLFREVRMVKTPYEISQMRIDGRKQVAVYEKISSLYTPGMTDLQLQIAIEYELRREGCLGFARVAGTLMEINMGSVLVGANADAPSPYEFAMGGEGADLSLPGGANGTLIETGESVMVDMNGSFNAYQTDMTRVWTMGELPERAYRAHACSIEILRRLEMEALPGKEIKELYFKAVEMAERDGLKECFMGYSQQSNFIGHGVGIELNETPPIAPRTPGVLKDGMTLAIEPKFVIPGVGAVGVENTYLVGKDGLECLTVMEEKIMEFKKL